MVGNDLPEKGRGQPDQRPQEPRAAHQRRQDALEPQCAPARACCAFNTKDPALSDQIKQLVDAICHGDDDPLLHEPAVAIAESQLWLSLIGHEKLAALERLRDPEEDALTGRYSRRGMAKIKAKLDLFSAPVTLPLTSSSR